MEVLYASSSAGEVLKRSLSYGRRRPMSISQFSKILGYKSDRLAGMVIKGQRVMSSQLGKKLANYLKLSSKEKYFLDLLIECDGLRHKNQNPSEIESLIHQLRPQEYKKRLLSEEELEIFSRWYTFTLFEVIRALNNKATLDQILNCLEGDPSRNEIESCLRQACQFKLLKKSGKTYSSMVPDEYFYSTNSIPSSWIRECHKNQLLRAQQALHEQSINERSFYSLNFMIRNGQFAEFEKQLADLIQEFSYKSAESNESDISVYQVNTQIYRQAKIPVSRPLDV